MLKEFYPSTRLSGCSLSYGIYRLDSPCLRSHLYPDDLPADWRLVYYNNEFNVILTTLEELEVERGLNRNTITSLCAGISHLVEEIHEKFILLIELTSDIHDTFTDNELEQLKNLSRAAGNLYFIRDIESASQVGVDAAEFSLFWLKTLFASESGARENPCCLMIKEKGQLTPPVLRQLLELCFQLADKKDELWVLFSSEEHALENCRNAVLLDSLM